MTAEETAVRGVVELLARGQYETVTAVDRGNRITASDLARTVEEYGRTLVSPPPEWWGVVELRAVGDPRERMTYAAVPLWTEQEGRSDLTLELSLSEIAPEAYEVALLDLRVL